MIPVALFAVKRSWIWMLSPSVVQPGHGDSAEFGVAGHVTGEFREPGPGVLGAPGQTGELGQEHLGIESGPVAHRARHEALGQFQVVQDPGAA